mmetsp:Transcript_21363/g.84972  ORF Transcript_21363/g.84972 Transcript_21363/m.84972 type:complete len:201 (+) Transcript_21363:672-1274(+)
MNRSSLCGTTESNAIETTAGATHDAPTRRGSHTMPQKTSGSDVVRARGTAEVQYQDRGMTPHRDDRFSTGLLNTSTAPSGHNSVGLRQSRVSTRPETAIAVVAAARHAKPQKATRRPSLRTKSTRRGRRRLPWLLCPLVPKRTHSAPSGSAMATTSQRSTAVTATRTTSGSVVLSSSESRAPYAHRTAGIASELGKNRDA